MYKQMVFKSIIPATAPLRVNHRLRGTIATIIDCNVLC